VWPPRPWSSRAALAILIAPKRSAMSDQRADAGVLPRHWAGRIASMVGVVVAASLAVVPAARADTLVGCDTAAFITAITNTPTGTLDVTGGCTDMLTSGPYSDGSGADSLPIITSAITGRATKRSSAWPFRSPNPAHAPGTI
jgi:hypothetical protein